MALAHCHAIAMHPMFIDITRQNLMCIQLLSTSILVCGMPPSISIGTGSMSNILFVRSLLSPTIFADYKVIRLAFLFAEIQKLV